MLVQECTTNLSRSHLNMKHTVSPEHVTFCPTSWPKSLSFACWHPRAQGICSVCSSLSRTVLANPWREAQAFSRYTPAPTCRVANQKWKQSITTVNRRRQHDRLYSRVILLMSCLLWVRHIQHMATCSADYTWTSLYYRHTYIHTYIHTYLHTYLHT
jgi:hypothetical protein